MQCNFQNVIRAETKNARQNRRPETVDRRSEKHRAQQKTINIICVWIYWATRPKLLVCPKDSRIEDSRSWHSSSLNDYGGCATRRRYKSRDDFQTSQTCHAIPARFALLVSNFFFCRSNEPLTRSCRRPRKFLRS